MFVGAHELAERDVIAGLLLVSEFREAFFDQAGVIRGAIRDRGGSEHRTCERVTFDREHAPATVFAPEGPPLVQTQVADAEQAMAWVPAMDSQPHTSDDPVFRF